MNNRPLMEKEIDKNVVFSMYQKGFIDRKTYITSLLIIGKEWKHMIFSLFFISVAAVLFLFFYFNFKDDLKEMDNSFKIVLFNIVTLSFFLAPLIPRIDRNTGNFLLGMGLFFGGFFLYESNNLYNFEINYKLILIEYVISALPIVMTRKSSYVWGVFLFLLGLGIYFLIQLEQIFG